MKKRCSSSYQGVKRGYDFVLIDCMTGWGMLTSLNQYALEGYKYQAVNSIVKPVKYIRLKTEMKGWIEKYRHKNPYIVVQNNKGSFKVAVKKLHYAETYKRNLLLHTDDGDVICYKT